MANLIKLPCDEAIIQSAPDTAPAPGRWVLVVTILGSSMAVIDGTAVNNEWLLTREERRG